MPVRGLALRRDHVIAASLAGAVVVIVGYASGLGLRPGTTAAAATPPVADGRQYVMPATPDQQSLPSGPLPSGTVPPLPAVPVDTGEAVAAQPSSPSISDAQPTEAPPSIPATTSTTPPGTPAPPPPGTTVPACRPGVTQQVLDAVGGLPVLGQVTTGLGVTGPDGVGATILGYCTAADGSLELAMVPAPATHGGQ